MIAYLKTLSPFISQAIQLERFAQAIECFDSALGNWIISEKKNSIKSDGALGLSPYSMKKLGIWNSITAVLNKKEMDYLFSHVDEDGRVTSISSIFRSLSNKSIQLWQAESSISVGEKIRVAVVGGFSSGKSSFINSLLGESFCPVNVAASTSSVTTFKYGDKKRIFVNDGSKEKEISQKNYEQMVTHQGGGKKKYEFTVYYPFEELRDVEIIDTPGFDNAANDEDERVTDKKIRLADVVFFVMDVNKGDITENMIKRLKNWTDERPALPLYAIINKADVKPNSACLKIKDHLHGQFSQFQDILIYSSKDELEKVQSKFNFESLGDAVLRFEKSVIKGEVKELFIHFDGNRFSSKEVIFNQSSGRSLIMSWFVLIHSEKAILLSARFSNDIKDFISKVTLLADASLIALKEISIKLYSSTDDLLRKNKNSNTLKVMEDYCAAGKVDFSTKSIEIEVRRVFSTALISMLKVIDCPNIERPFIFSAYVKLVIKDKKSFYHRIVDEVTHIVVSYFDRVFHCIPLVIKDNLIEKKSDFVNQIIKSIKSSAELDFNTLVDENAGKPLSKGRVVRKYYEYPSEALGCYVEVSHVVCIDYASPIIDVLATTLSNLDVLVNIYVKKIVETNEINIREITKLISDINDFSAETKVLVSAIT